MRALPARLVAALAVLATACGLNPFNHDAAPMDPSSGDMPAANADAGSAATPQTPSMEPAGTPIATPTKPGPGAKTPTASPGPLGGRDGGTDKGGEGGTDGDGGAGPGSGDDASAAKPVAGDAPRGVFCDCPISRAGSSAILPDIAAKDFVAGFLVRAAWADLEPTEGDLHFDLLDAEIAAAKQANKKVTIAVLNGPSAPSWVGDKGAATITFTLGRRQQATMPVPWDPIFLDAWTTFIGKLGAHLEAEPTVALVHATSSTANGFDMTLPFPPLDNGATRDAWTQLGYTDDLELGSWTQVLDAFGAAFPSKPVDVDVHPVLGEDTIAQKTVAHGTEKLGARFGAFASWFSTRNTLQLPGMFDLVTQSATASYATVQIAAGPSTFSDSLTLGLSKNIHYFEIVPNALNAPELDGVLRDTATKATAK
jgi:hypothetical protein